MADATARAEVLIELGRFTEALPFLGAAIATDPNASRPRCLLAQALLGLSRNVDALNAADSAVACEPESSWAHRLRAIALLRRHRLKHAQFAADEAVRLSPNDPVALEVVVQCQLAAHRLSEAEEAARDALRVAPRSVSAQNAYALWALNARRPRDAEAACRRALEIDPVNDAAMNNLGVALFRRGRYWQALRVYSNVIRLNPTFDTPQRNLRLVVRRLLAFVAFGTLIAAIVAVSWIRNESTLSSFAGAVAITCMAAAAIAVIGGLVWLYRSAPRPAAVVAKQELVSIGRPRSETPARQSPAAWLAPSRTPRWTIRRLAARPRAPQSRQRRRPVRWNRGIVLAGVLIAAFFALGFLELLVSPQRAGDRTAAAIGLAIAIAACVVGIPKLRRGSRGAQPPN